LIQQPILTFVVLYCKCIVIVVYVCSNLVFLLYYEVPDQFADGAPLEMAQSLSHEGIPCDRQTIKPVYSD